MLDLMAKSKLKTMNSESDFHSIIEIMNEIIRLKKEAINGMIHSEGLHIDADLAFYLYEAGLLEQAKKYY